LLFALQACGGEDHGTAENPTEGYLYGVVVGVTDGDTLTILTPMKQQAKIRLAEIDTPERRQPFGTWAKEQLAELVLQKEIAIRFVDIDRYDRVVGREYVGNLDVNGEPVRIGAAWVYDKYVTDMSLYDLQEEAKEAGRGLWRDPNPMPP
jgi:micrococcal nuclease